MSNHFSLSMSFSILYCLLTEVLAPLLICLYYYSLFMLFCSASDLLTRLILYVSSKIVFKTAGVLLDEMREKGLKALRYKVIVLDEVHERSVESDLVLVCIKQFLLRNKDLRLAICILNLRTFLSLKTHAS